jgi:hypothetical protein
MTTCPLPIPPAGTHDGETFTAESTPGPEILICCGPSTPPGSGALLAESLRGRWSRSYRGYYLTPARARKWHTLLTAGFSAHRRGEEWRYQCGPWRNMKLHEAMRTIGIRSQQKGRAA